jgi:hypothetical protein
MDRVNPDEYAVGLQKLLAHLFRERLVVNRRFGLNAPCRQFFEDAVRAIVGGRCGLSRRSIARAIK